MWSNAARWNGPKADEPRRGTPDSDAIARIGSGPARNSGYSPAGAQAAGSSRTLPLASPPFRRGCHPPPERGGAVVGPNEPSARTPEVPKTGRAAPNSPGWSRPAIETVEEHSSRRPHRSGRTPPTFRCGGAPRAIARIEMDVREWQRCVVGKVLQSPEITLDPGAGAGRIAIKLIAGARSGGAPASSTVEQWRWPALTNRQVFLGQATCVVPYRARRANGRRGMYKSMYKSCQHASLSLERSRARRRTT